MDLEAQETLKWAVGAILEGLKGSQSIELHQVPWRRFQLSIKKHIVSHCKSSG